MPNKAQDDDLVMGLVELAMTRSVDEREAYVRSACDGDTLLFGQVWTYVQWEERMKDFLLEPLFPPAPCEHPFEAGEILDGRFRIVREVAQGGMGIVYEATDEKLERKVALKCAKSGYRKRLPPEVRHATEISHPNVCKIFEIHTASTAQGEIDFITMEFLEGETLAERLSRGPLLEAEARSIARQLCAGLAEAHRKKVIHGDLKSNNVILTKGADGSVQAVITDFGLARGHEIAQRTAQPQSGTLAGTPDYMAPELWKGGKVSVASDIYALGVILYELVAGRKPYSPGSSWEERLNRKPPAAHPKWDRILARCLDPDPLVRPDAQQVADAFAPPHSRRWFLAAVAAVLIAGVFAVTEYAWLTAPTETMRLAVLPFDSDTETQRFSDGLLYDTSERLARVKPGRAKLTLISVGDALAYKIRVPEGAGAKLGATHALSGSFRKINGLINVHAYLTDARTKVRLTDWQAEYPIDELRNVPIALAGMVTGALRLPPLSLTPSVNAAAYADFWAGGIALARGEAGLDDAIPLLERAVASDPDSPLTHAKLAEAQWRKYRASNEPQWSLSAQASLKKAEQRNPDVAAVRLVSGMIHEGFGQYEQAQADFRRAIELEPANANVYRQLGHVYEDYNQADQAMAAYRKAIELQPEYFGNYQDFGGFYFRRGDYEESLQQYRKMVHLAPDLVAAHYALASTYLNMGIYADAEAELHTAITYQETANAVEGLGLSRMYQNRDREAIPFFQRALEIGPKTSLFYINLGTSLRRANFPHESEQDYRNGLALALEELAKNPKKAYERSCFAYLSARLGDRMLAQSEAVQAMQLSGGATNVRWMVALTYEALGQRERTLTVIQESPNWQLSRLNRFPDLADLQQDSRFKQLLVSHNIQ